MTDDIPTADTLRLHMGDLTANEVRVAQAAIRFDRSQRSETVAQTRDAALAKAVAIMDDERNQRGATKACDGLWTARTRVAALRTIPPADSVAQAARVIVNDMYARDAIKHWADSSALSALERLAQQETDT